MSDITELDFTLLKVLDALLEERSTTAAARRLKLSQSTVSGVLARLRRVLNDPLFLRVQRGLLPTPRAEALAGPVKELLAGANGLLAPLKFDPAEYDATLSISVNDYMQQSLVVPFIAALRREAPKLRIAVRPPAIANLMDALVRGVFDVAVTVPEFAHPDLPSRLLYREPYVGAFRPGHPLAGKRVSLAAFCSHEHVLVSPESGAFHGPTDAALAALGRKRRVRLSVPSFLLMPEVLATGDYMAMIPARLARSFGKRIRTFQPPLEVPGIDAIAVWHRRVHRDPAHIWLRERLAQTAAELPA